MFKMKAVFTLATPQVYGVELPCQVNLVIVEAEPVLGFCVDVPRTHQDRHFRSWGEAREWAVVRSEEIARQYEAAWRSQQKLAAECPSDPIFTFWTPASEGVFHG